MSQTSYREERLHFIVDREIDWPTLFCSYQVQGYITYRHIGGQLRACVSFYWMHFLWFTMWLRRDTWYFQNRIILSLHNYLLYHKRGWWDEFSTLFRTGANGRKRFDLGLLPSGELSSDICSFPPSGSSAKNPRISSKVELNEAFKSLSVITRLLWSVLFLVVSSSRSEWTRKFKISHKYQPASSNQLIQRSNRHRRCIVKSSLDVTICRFQHSNFWKGSTHTSMKIFRW